MSISLLRDKLLETFLCNHHRNYNPQSKVTLIVNQSILKQYYPILIYKMPNPKGLFQRQNFHLAFVRQNLFTRSEEIVVIQFGLEI
ncbi:hypothetical protein FGO68_gene7088 [Halteria grandinella]|uniref:Uncharacterized protein n=1 Tax=Halteria grandinella TaxID=5974 RepID=A0A8J8SXY1_HALGN|nr:hypothetical protein FGO68_gene7088 [Halteria grandinella]